MHQNEFEQPDWSEIAQKIKEGDVVLILGPDAIPMFQAKGEPLDYEGDMTFSRLSRLKIKQNPRVKVAHYYERDNLFLFQDARAKLDAKKAVCNFVKEKDWMPDEELLRQIVSIPFHLVLTINPDLYLKDAFSRYQLDTQFDYFATSGKEINSALKVPTNSNPLLYNLCGSLENFNSIVLDYQDLFGLMKNMLNDTNVPDELRIKLKKTDTYILLGFQFERWYFQLLLHYLSMIDGDFNNANQVFSLNMKEKDEDTQAFMIKQFNLEYIAPDRSDFEKLYQACDEQGILRNIANPLSGAAAAVRDAIVRNDFVAAFGLLDKQKAHFDLDATYLLMLQSQYQQWKTEYDKGTTDSRDLDVQIKQIRYKLLTLANQIS